MKIWKQQMNKLMNKNEQKLTGMWCVHCECDIHIMFTWRIENYSTKTISCIIFILHLIDKLFNMKSWTFIPRVKRYF